MRKAIITLIIFVMFIAFFPGYCLAADQTESSILTVERAVEIALQNREDLKQASSDLEAAEITRDRVWDAANAALMKTYIPGADLYVSIPTDSDPTGKVYTSHYNWLAQQTAYNTKKEAVTMAVYQKYYDILNAIDNVGSKQLASEQSAENLRIVQVRHNLGMDTSATLYQAQMEAATAQAEYEAAQKNLEQKYTDFIQYIGLPAGSRPQLEDNLVYTPADIQNVDMAIKKVVDNSPSVFLANEAVRLQEKTRGLSGSYKLDDANRDSAQAGADLAYEQMESAVRNIYYQIKNIEDSYPAVVESNRAAEEGLRVAKLMYEVGMITKADVMKAEAAASSAKNALNSLVRNHEILKMAFEKPWAMTAQIKENSSGE